MNLFDNPVVGFVLFIVFVGLLGFFVKAKQKRTEAAIAKLSPFEVAVQQQGFKGTEEEWLASLPRKERRALMFANQTDDEVKDRATNFQQQAYIKFLTNVGNAIYNAGDNYSVLLRDLLAVAEKEIHDYRKRAHLTERAEGYITMVEISIMRHLSEMLIQSASNCRVSDLSGSAHELVKFMETNFRVGQLNGVMYRNKATVSQSQRASAMSHSILKFFTDGNWGTNEVCNIPLDYLPLSEMYTNDDFRRDFFHVAVDNTYRDMMKDSDREKFRSAERVRNDNHQSNRKQRKRRLEKSKQRV